MAPLNFVELLITLLPTHEKNRDNRVNDRLLIRVGNKTREWSCHEVCTFCALEMP